MRKICVYIVKGGIAQQSTASKFWQLIGRANLSQREVARRMGMYPGQLSELLAGKPRYRWSEDIARRIMAALKAKKCEDIARRIRLAIQQKRKP